VLFASGMATLGVAVAFMGYALHSERVLNDSLQLRIAQLERIAAMPVARSASSAEPQAVTPALASVAVSTRPQQKDSAGSEPSMEDESRTQAQSWLQQLTSNPKLLAGQVRQRRNQIEDGYVDLAKSLQLSPEIMDRFLNLLARQEIMNSAHEQAAAYSRPPDEAGIEERKRELERHAQDIAAERRAVIGDEGMARWNEYWRTQGARSQLRSLQMQLVDSNNALRDEQMEPLVSVLSAERERHTTEREALFAESSSKPNPSAADTMKHMERRFALIEQSIQRQRDAAAPYLDREQMAAFSTMLDRDLQRARDELAVWRASTRIAAQSDPGH